MSAPYEPLIQSAPVALAAAKRHCRNDSSLGQSCFWFHGYWQYFRILDVVSGLQPHQDFFRTALGALAGDGDYPRVLISGAADYAMLAHVLSAYKENGAAMEITVLDQCETPLVLNRWYAERRSLNVETWACNILDFECAGTFDVICTHSFLHHIPRKRRPDLIAKWRQLLRPGGRLMTVERIIPSAAKDPVTYTPEETLAFRDRVLAAARKAPNLPGTTAEDLAASADAHARRHRYLLRSFEELRDLLVQGGFTIDRLHPSETAELAGGSGMTAPAASGDLTDYAHILGSRA